MIRVQIPANYFEKVYAGWLGKIIGIRLGAPVEGWSYEKIKSIYGELTHYPADFKNFAADDDSNGPLFFIRALEDCQNLNEFSSQDVAHALLNYAPFEHGFFWWGGYGISTEHTAYLNLRNGIPAPRSGSIEQNGATMAEQIGGQIFIDPWGLVAPGNPALAASLAEKAAGVTHGGNGIYGGIFIACAISLAFVETEITAILEKALSYIPADCDYAKVTRAVMAFHQEHPQDWRACFQFLHDHYGYDKYPGNCHIIPNAGVIILSMLYGKGNYTDTINICNMCGWDTDCNVGNVGCILGVLVGLEGIDQEKWVKPINDFLACSSVVGSLNATDIPFGASYFAKMAYLLSQEEIPAQFKEILEDKIDSCHFEYPTSTHAIRGNCPGNYHIRNTDECAHSGKRSLKLTALWSGAGVENYFYKQTYYRPADFDDSRYDPFFSPLVYPGQTVHMSLYPQAAEGLDAYAQPYVKLGSGELIKGEKLWAKDCNGWQEITLKIPGGLEDYVLETGVILSGVAKGFAGAALCCYLDDLFYTGAPDYKLNFSKLEMEVWHGMHQDVSQFARLKGHAYLEAGHLNLSCGDFGELYTGHHTWTDYLLEGDVTPVTGADCGLNLRVQGAMRSYFAGFQGEKLVLQKNLYGYSTLCEVPFSWEAGKTYRLGVTAKGNTLSLSVNGQDMLFYTDDSQPLLTGSAGVSVKNGSHCRYGDFIIKGIEQA